MAASPSFEVLRKSSTSEEAESEESMVAETWSCEPAIDTSARFLIISCAEIACGAAKIKAMTVITTRAEDPESRERREPLKPVRSAILLFNEPNARFSPKIPLLTVCRWFASLLACDPDRRVG